MRTRKPALLMYSRPERSSTIRSPPSVQRVTNGSRAFLKPSELTWLMRPTGRSTTVSARRLGARSMAVSMQRELRDQGARRPGRGLGDFSTAATVARPSAGARGTLHRHVRAAPPPGSSPADRRATIAPEGADDRAKAPRQVLENLGRGANPARAAGGALRPSRGQGQAHPRNRRALRPALVGQEAARA